MYVQDKQTLVIQVTIGQYMSHFSPAPFNLTIVQYINIYSKDMYPKCHPLAYLTIVHGADHD